MFTRPASGGTVRALMPWDHLKASRGTPLRLALIVVLFASVLAIDTSAPRATITLEKPAVERTRDLPLRLNVPADLPTQFVLSLDVFSGLAEDANVLSISGSTGPVIRLSEQEKNLVLTLFGIDSAPITVSRQFSPRHWHHLDIRSTRDGIDVTVDRQTTRLDMARIRQLQSSAEIGARDLTFRFSEITIGSESTGALEPAVRAISGLSIRAQYIRRYPWIASALAAGLALLALLVLLRPWLSKIEIPTVTLSDLSALFVIVGSVAVGFSIARATPFGKWSIFLAMPIGAMLAVGAAGKIRPIPLPRALGTVLLLLLGAVPLLTLTNSVAIWRMFERWPLTSTFVVVVGLFVAALVANRLASAPRERRWFVWLPYLVFAVLSVRLDSVFAPINALHWEYVVGPIRAIHEGGWLLWDVPSQYGFLNILIASLLPIRPAVDAFFWFQGIAFFVVSSIFYRTLYAKIGLNWIAAAAVVVAFFFFADPLLIGPTPYPSMSAARFLWCYVLLAMAATNYFGPSPSVMRFTRQGVLVWLAGVLWSAESAIYVTVIYLIPLFIGAVFGSPRRPIPTVFRDIVRIMLWPAIGLVAVVACIDVLYLARLGHLPDWSMFAAYSRSYSAGFGEQPIPPFGPIWLPVTILFGGVVAMVRAREQKVRAHEYAAMTALAAVWIVSSYYIGRAFPIVISTLFPLLIFGAFVVARCDGNKRSSLQATMMTPLLALGLVSAFWNSQGPSTVAAIAHPTLSAWKRLPVADDELATLLARNNVTPTTPIVYYDTWVAMPRAATGPYEQTWLPTPLQQLEAPITRTMRDQIVTRFIERHHMEGYFVEAIGGPNVSATTQDWFTLLSRFYDVKRVAQNEDYVLFRVFLRKSGKAGTAS